MACAVCDNSWQPVETAPFSTWILLLWEGGTPKPHREIVIGSVVINQEFQRDEYWNGYEYRPVDQIIGWMPLPDTSTELPSESSLWNVVYGNYFPREVESTWPTEAAAKARIETLETEQDAKGLGIGMWWAEKTGITTEQTLDPASSPDALQLEDHAPAE